MKRRQFFETAAYTAAAIGFSSCTGTSKKTVSRPNILICIADDASWPHMGIYGCDWVKTPGFDRVAREGLLFNRAYTPNAKCAPSRSCILTGRNSWQLEEAANHWCYFPEKFASFFEALDGNGYHCGYTSKGWAPGIAENADGTKRHLTGTVYNKRKAEPPAEYICPDDYAANFIDFLDDKSPDKPFCFWYGSREPHRRYEYGAGVEKGGKKISDIDHVYDFWPDNETVRTDMLDYAFEIEYFDSHLVRMLAELEKRGELDNTIIVVTADNGMPFPRIKGQEYEYSNHLPLAIMWKRGITSPGRAIDDFVSFIDFAPTFLEYAGVPEQESGMQPITGKSLATIFESGRKGQNEPKRDHVLIGKERHDIGRPGDVGYPIRGIVKGDYLFIHNFETGRWPAGNPETGYLNCDGSPTKTEILNLKRDNTAPQFWTCSFGKRPSDELYNIADDPVCMENLAESHEALCEEFRSQLFAELTEQDDPRMSGRAELFDKYLYADESGRNFYERYMRGEKVNFGWVNDSDFGH